MRGEEWGDCSKAFRRVAAPDPPDKACETYARTVFGSGVCGAGLTGRPWAGEQLGAVFGEGGRVERTPWQIATLAPARWPARELQAESSPRATQNNSEQTYATE